MLFNSYAFIFLFLPIALLGYFVLGRVGNLAPVIWLALASLAFYSVSNWQFVALLLASIAFNYVIGWLLISKHLRPGPRFAVLTVGVAGDLLVLGYFKYAGFLAANLNALFSTGLTVNILLPVGISFYTFTQIAFLVDAYRGQVAHYALPHYALFVSYFPHLIAGPILHHKDMIPQFERAESKRPDPHLILCGLIIFAIGLFKKTCLADGIQPLVTLAFGPAPPSFDQAWIGALAYTFQLYFDFSGYSDMAIGISLMFGIFLPLNFNSPYKAQNIIDFWRRWHMTLSQFLRDYLYIPLGGNRRGRVLRYVNLMVTMALGGLWHGAAWTFVAWGVLHGVYLCINHAWNNYGPAVAPRFTRLANLAAFALTFLAVVVAWVLFRADSMASAISILTKMASPSQIVLGRVEMAYSVFIVAYAALAWLAPNTQTIMGYDHTNRTVGEALGRWQKRPAFLYATAAVLAFGILGIQQHSEFIYFRF
ncbi:MBOAT family O-acyltransferase [Bradyrhizobium erythrophlei]|jgi:D-alanyl-lipoteichoic acid acyltransferase DltB (MBOAT superfamily)|uniref:Probable alginate O-acetylase AlgI n=1 Tax=Bradyrhizobium erythrophlei TaxID=1437360 RepID=A0A1M5YY26_9BRAD|nr:MBOAT family protein [Bradyrhizobium erythrophlei]SHI16917.1 D-alanyl-lipoteichoic acid acyltransferase DltB, MBOAT superfamily [Bradyrhizobium erythrophlei]